MTPRPILATFVPQLVDPNDEGNILYADEDFVYEFAAREYGKSRRSTPLRFTWDVTAHLLAMPLLDLQELADDRDESDDLLWDVLDSPGWARNYAGQHPYVVRVRESLKAYCAAAAGKPLADLADGDLATLRAAYHA